MATLGTYDGLTPRRKPHSAGMHIASARHRSPVGSLVQNALSRYVRLPRPESIRMDLVVVGPDDDLHMEMVNERPRAASLGDGVMVTWEVPLAKAEGFPRLIELTLHVAGDVPLALAAHVIADWVLARFRGKAEKIVVHRREIEFDAGEVRRIVEETITHERGG